MRSHFMDYDLRSMGMELKDTLILELKFMHSYIAQLYNLHCFH